MSSIPREALRTLQAFPLIIHFTRGTLVLTCRINLRSDIFLYCRVNLYW
jgi:hypothetical protein